VSGRVLENAGTFAVLVRRQLLDHTRANVACAGERSIDVGHAHLDQVCGDAPAWRNSISTDLRDHDGAVYSDAQLCAV
jgi:hypothetical protein